MQPNATSFPPHPPREFPPVKACIYCGATERLSTEHIIPFSAGGKWVLPKASCRTCAALTGTFEGEFARTILGPLRMPFNMPTRRPKERPRHLPLADACSAVVFSATPDDVCAVYIDGQIVHEGSTP